MADAGVTDGAEGAMAELETLEKAAMAEAQAAAAAMTNLAQKVNLWQKKRREIERQSASLVKNQLTQMHSKIQELEKRMEEKTQRLVKTYLEEEMKKQGTAVQTTPTPQTMPTVQITPTLQTTPTPQTIRTLPTTPTLQTTPIAHHQGMHSSQGRPTEQAGISSGAQRIGMSPVDSFLSTPSRPQLPPQGNVTPTTPCHAPANHTSSSFSSVPSPSPSIPSHLDRNQVSLHAAVKSARIRDVKSYLSLGVDPRFEDEEGNTLLHLAAKSARQKILKVLLLSGRMKVDALDSDGKTALHVASSLPNGGICVNILLVHKADVNKRDHKGETPLHCAARNDNEKIVEMLLQKKADPSITNNDGETPFHVARTIGVRRLLQPQYLSSPPAGEPFDPSFYVSTSMAGEMNFEDNFIQN